MLVSRLVRRFALLSLAGLAGCVSGLQWGGGQVTGAATELNDVPFCPGDEDQGGPAALAMMLGASGAQATPEELQGLGYVAADAKGSAAAMRAAAGRYGLAAYELSSKRADLDAAQQLRSGHPLLVLLHDGLLLKQWHYAVLIGVDPAANSFILRSGSAQLQVLSHGDLMRAWHDSGYWAMLIVGPADIPPAASAADWLAAAGSIEHAGKFEAAAQAYTAITRRWPDDAEAWSGLGRSDYALRDVRGAVVAFNRAAILQPNNASFHHGLAQALLQRQCADQAETEAGIALDLEQAPALRAAYLNTQKEAQDHSGPSVVCPLDEGGSR